MSSKEDSLFLSVVTSIEIKTGLLKMGRLSPGQRQQAMLAWYHQLETDFADKILPLTREIVDDAARIADLNAARGLQPGWPDVVIAATAASHGMTLLTRNLRHYAFAGVPILDPFQSIPE